MVPRAWGRRLAGSPLIRRTQMGQMGKACHRWCVGSSHDTHNQHLDSFPRVPGAPDPPLASLLPLAHLLRFYQSLAAPTTPPKDGFTTAVSGKIPPGRAQPLSSQVPRPALARHGCCAFLLLPPHFRSLPCKLVAVVAFQGHETLYTPSTEPTRAYLRPSQPRQLRLPAIDLDGHKEPSRPERELTAALEAMTNSPSPFT
jgi:hypothetical protein